MPDLTLCRSYVKELEDRMQATEELLHEVMALR